MSIGYLGKNGFGGTRDIRKLLYFAKLPNLERKRKKDNLRVAHVCVHKILLSQSFHSQSSLKTSFRFRHVFAFHSLYKTPSEMQKAP